MENAIQNAKAGLRENYPTLDEALDRAIQPHDRPFVIADTSDNPGGGGLGNTTHILRRVLERGIEGGAMAMIVDPEFVKLCEQAGVGATVEGDLGGWSDPVYSGGPLHVTAYVRSITDGNYVQKGQMSNGALIRMGKTAVVKIGGNQVIVASLPTQPYDLEVFRSHGIEPADQKFLIVKSAIHYRASYGTVAGEMVAVPLPGYIPPIPELFTFRNWKGGI
jgi:microcystin degradation protein MlrC